jgi:hypothetical protein
MYVGDEITAIHADDPEKKVNLLELGNRKVGEVKCLVVICNNLK